MVDCQVRPSDVTKFPIIDSMLRVPREGFVPASKREVAYAGAHVDLGDGRVVLDPRSLAKMLDFLDIGPEELVLNIGCGLGYESAVIAHMAEAVIAVEEDEHLAAEAEANLLANSADNVVVITGALAEGAAKHGPYDVVVFNGGVETISDAVLAQVKDGGRIAAIFMDGQAGQCRVGLKTGVHVAWRNAFDATAPVLPGMEKVLEFTL